MMPNLPAQRAHAARFALAFSLVPLALISLRLSALLGVCLVVLILLPARRKPERAHDPPHEHEATEDHETRSARDARTEVPSPA